MPEHDKIYYPWRKLYSKYDVFDLFIVNLVVYDFIEIMLEIKAGMEEKNKIYSAVHKRYAGLINAEADDSDCGCTPSGCCSPQNADISGSVSRSLGYSQDEINTIPAGSNLGLGCGNPHVFAALKSGETVLDLGCGGGMDCFLAARAVGETGKVIGVDMTPEMIMKARENAEKGAYKNVDFRLGEIEHLPVADQSVDIIISNCVINLSPEKGQVFAEAFRVLKPCGRLAISDVVLTGVMPEAVRSDLDMHCSCISGASAVDELESTLSQSGFEDVRIVINEESREFIREWQPGLDVNQFIASANIEARKPTDIK